MLPWGGKLGDILFDGSAKSIVRLLAAPVRPSSRREFPYRISSVSTDNHSSADTQVANVSQSVQFHLHHTASPPRPLQVLTYLPLCASASQHSAGIILSDLGGKMVTKWWRPAGRTEYVS